MSTNENEKRSVINTLAEAKIRHFQGRHTVAIPAFSPRRPKGKAIEDPIIVNKRPSLAEKLELAGAGCGSCGCQGGEPPAAQVALHFATPGRHPLDRVNPKIPKNKTPESGNDMKETKLSRMRQARRAAGLTIEELAAKTGLPYSTVRTIEIGIGLNYPAATKHKISRFLGVPFFDMFPEEREPLRGLVDEILESREKWRRP